LRIARYAWMRLMIRERMYAALSATNEAILRTTAPDDLFQRVCDAAVEAGGFQSAGVLLPDNDGWLRLAAAAGFDKTQPLPDLRISTDESSERGRGIAGAAYRNGKSFIANDFQNDPRFTPWRSSGMGEGVGAAAAIPILRGGRSIGVFLLLVGEAGSLGDDVVSLLERMAENVAFAIGGFERERERKAGERALRRSSDMFAALSATNSAILQATDQGEMLRLVCESVSKGGQSLGAAAIFLKESGSEWLKPAAASGALVDTISKMPLSIDPNHKFGGGLHGPAFREQTLQITYDTAIDPRTQPWYARGAVPHGCAAVPLTKYGVSEGVLFFFFARTSGREDAGILQLMSDIGKNVSFALEMFEREAHKEKLARMFAALSATNEAIMRAQTRDELYQFVCEAIVDAAKFTSATIALVDESGEYLKVRGVSGPNVERIRKLVLATSAERPEGRGMSGVAYRTGKPAISNEWLADTRTSHFRNNESGTRSGAAFPLFLGDNPIGVMLFLSGEAGTFSPEFVEVLERLARNVSFAMAAFERTDEKVRAEQRIAHMATHDGLTGLPNRMLFSQLLDQAVACAKRTRRKCAVLFIDLDRFKIVNDTLGHTAGDSLLCEAAHRLRSSVRESDIVARLGGDEFVVLLNDVTGKPSVEAMARKVLANLVPPMCIAGHECRTTGSIGVAMYPDDGADGATLTKNADAAMYVAKEEGKNDFRFYTTALKSQSIERLMLETSLRHALERDEFTLHYQPKICVATGAVSGVEALLRWTHPDLGNLAPMKFIPLAEETGLIIPIGRWVLKAACAQAMSWQREGLPPMSMAVNLSPRQFQDEHLLRDVEDALQESGLPPHLLQLEITESMVMQNVTRAINTLDAIQARGVRLAIDDFGTGYSSMSMMKQFPIDTIKIDRSFIRDLADNVEDQAIATAIINMGKALGLTIVAEGVETSEQGAFLRAGACDELQGYLFSKPLPAAEIPEALLPLMCSPRLLPTERGHALVARSRNPEGAP
jgi:diguanylate cyclase (GGDEF)-like protein